MKNINIINNSEANPTIPSLTPPFIPLPTVASKTPIIQNKIYFTIFNLSPPKQSSITPYTFPN